MAEDSSRTRLQAWLLKQLHKPYIINTDGPDTFDCSGLVCAAVRMLHPKVDWRATHNTARLFKNLVPTQEPAPLDLVFYEGHVMFVWIDGRVYGACGGDFTTKTLAKAEEMNARVQFRSRIHYRGDFIGFRKFPFEIPASEKETDKFAMYPPKGVA